MSATKSKAGVIAARDLSAALRHARSARAEAVEVRPDGSLRFLGRDGDVAAHVPFACRRWGGGARWVGTATLAKVLRACGDAVSVESVDGALRLAWGATTVDLPEQPRPRTYLDVNADAERRELFTMDAATLGRVLATAEPFASRDYTRPVIQAVALDTGRGKVVSTDSYRLALLDAPEIQIDDGETFTVALEGVKLLASLLSRCDGTVTVAEGDHDVAFLFDGHVWALRRRDGRYPNWFDLLPEDDAPTAFAVAAPELTRASGLIDSLSANNAPMVITARGRSVVVASRGHRGTTRAETRLDAAVSACPRGGVEVGADPAYMREIASAFGAATVEVAMHGPLRPIVLSAPGVEFLLMPIRLNV
jgi:DNA polymerase III sliding clamp (beta) subunit (PCNA family)